MARAHKGQPVLAAMDTETGPWQGRQAEPRQMEAQILELEGIHARTRPLLPLWSPTPGPAHHLSPGYWLLPAPLSSTISLAARGTLPNPQSPSVAPLQSLQHGACRLATPQAVPEVASLPPPLLLAPQCFLTTLDRVPQAGRKLPIYKSDSHRRNPIRGKRSQET